jgi:hypothetical protein
MVVERMSRLSTARRPERRKSVFRLYPHGSPGDCVRPGGDGMTERTEHELAVERAARRVKELRDFYVHLAVYLVVNTGLVIIDLVQGDGLQ